MNLHLPLHPSNRHPLTGAPIRAIAIHPKTGRPVWPIMGGAPDDPPKQDPPSDDPPSDDPPKQDPPKDDKPEGFPANTPVAEMTVAQQVAYWQHQSRKHETRATEYRQAAGGKSAAEIKADLDAAAELRRQSLSDQEKAVEDARKEGRAAGATEVGTAAARMAFELILGHDAEKNDRSALIDTLDLTKVLTDAGTVDTAKVRAIAGQIAPADKDTGGRQHFDFGGGSRGGTREKTGVSAGADLFANRNKSTSTS